MIHKVSQAGETYIFGVGRDISDRAFSGDIDEMRLELRWREFLNCEGRVF